MSHFNEVIAHFFDKDGNKGDIKLKDAYMTQMDMLRLMYFDFMIRCTDPDFEEFLQIHLKATETMIRVIDSKYADHVEGMRLAAEEKEKEKENG